jgi:hypothetical protein
MQLLQQKVAAQKISIAADDHGVALRIKANDVKRGRCGNPQAPSLPDGVGVQAVVTANLLAGKGQNRTWLAFSSTVVCNELADAAVGQKTYILTLFTGKTAKTFFCDKAVGLGLFLRSQRENDPGQLVLIKAREKIRLIFFTISSGKQVPTDAILSNFCIMAGRQFTHSSAKDAVEEQAKFDFLVADHAGVGSQTAAIFSGGIVKNLADEGEAKIDHRQWDSHPSGDPLDSLQLSRVIGLTEVHEKAVYLANLAEQQGAGCRIHSATHRDAHLSAALLLVVLVHESAQRVGEAGQWLRVS